MGAISNIAGKLLNPGIGGSGVRQAVRDLWSIYGNPSTPQGESGVVPGAGSLWDDGTVALVTIDAKEIAAPVAAADGSAIATTTPVGTTSYVSKAFYTQGFSVICGSCFSNANGTVYVDQSADGTNWDVSTSVAVTGGTGASLGNISVVAPYARVRFVPGASNTTLRLYPFLRRI